MKRRICTDVISQMMKFIPESKTDFIKDLNQNYEDASYKAPEENIQWARTSNTLQKHLPNPTEEWEFTILSIFSGESIEYIRGCFKDDSFEKVYP